nr:PREDICTED: zinc finger CCCH domain-containing protein 14 [Bemisia tabaci]
MEGVGAEISQKIKSAIKAKLMEIGAFVDDELPDYIMVMVANKRTKAQMNDDLSLFLGSNTHHFTSWLHSVLEQLKQVTLISQAAKGSKDSSKRKSTASGDNASEERERKKKRKESKDESEVPTSSLPVSDITDRIKQELISEFSKDANIVTQVPSEVPKNKRPLDSAPEETESSIQPAKASEVPPEKVSEDNKSSSKKDAAAAARKVKHSAEVTKEVSVEKELVTNKKVIENGGKDGNSAKEDSEDSLSIELSSDENEYINIKNDDLFLSGDDDVATPCPPSIKSVSSKAISLKANDPRSSRRHSGSKETLSKRGRSPEPSRSTSGARDDHRRVVLDRSKEPSRRDTERTKSDANSVGSKKVMDAREVLNWKRSLSKGQASGGEKSEEQSRNKSIFDRLSGNSARSSDRVRERSVERIRQRSGERVRERSSERSQRVASKDHSRSKDDSRSSVKSSVNITENKKRDRRTDDIQAASTLAKRQKISISEIAKVERELLRGVQKVAAVKPQVTSQVSSRSLAQSSRSHERESRSSQSSSRRKEKVPENRLASQVIAKEPEPEDEDIVADVPSVVKVTPRPVIPSAKAAPRNLILKAVAEAEKSIQSSPVRSEKLRSKEREKKSKRSKEKFTKNISPACISITLPNDRVGINKDGNISETWLDDSEDEEVKTEVRPSIDILKLYQSSRREGPLSSRRNPNRRSPSRRSISPPRKKPTEYEDEYSGDGDGDSIEFNISENSLPDEDLDPEPKKEPSFIVTLNNLDPMIKARAESEESKAVNRVKPQRIYPEKLDESSNETTLPMIHKAVSPVIISVSPSSPESSDETTLKKTVPTVSKPVTTYVAPKVSATNKVADVCKFWPNCLAGDKCPYVHISTPCVNFPNCKFGNRCLYTHPKCKFLTACVRKNCPYSHPVSSLPLSSPALSSQQCKYFPQCTKTGCPYFHPKVCKFGPNCVTKDCIFAHIYSSSGNKFKWSKSSSSQPLSIYL